MTVDITPEAVERFDLQQPESHTGSAYMQAEPGLGDWVRYSDYAALSARVAELEALARESALDALAAYGQAADAHTAQLAAEAALATARADALREAAECLRKHVNETYAYTGESAITAILALIPQQEKPNLHWPNRERHMEQR